MEFGVVLLTIGAYGLAIYLWSRDRTAIYIVALVAGQLSALPSPIWQMLYAFSYDQSFSTLYTLLDNPLPRPIALAAWTIMLPPLIALYLSRWRAWFSSYASSLLLFAVFALYHLLIETIGTRANWWDYSGGTLPFGVSNMLLAGLMNALISLGALTALVLTRHYTFSSLLIFLLPVPLVLRLLVQGLLGAPLYTVFLIQTYVPGLTPQSWADAIGVLGTLALLVWGTHIVASTLARQRDSHVPI